MSTIATQSSTVEPSILRFDMILSENSWAERRSSYKFCKIDEPLADIITNAISSEKFIYFRQ